MILQNMSAHLPGATGAGVGVAGGSLAALGVCQPVQGQGAGPAWLFTRLFGLEHS